MIRVLAGNLPYLGQTLNFSLPLGVEKGQKACPVIDTGCGLACNRDNELSKNNSKGELPCGTCKR